MKEILEILKEPYQFTENVSVSIMDFLILAAVLVIASLLLTLSKAVRQ
jgi:hypothetical protein